MAAIMYVLQLIPYHSETAVHVYTFSQFSMHIHIASSPCMQALPLRDHSTFDSLREKMGQFSMSQRVNDRARGEPGDKATITQSLIRLVL